MYDYPPEKDFPEFRKRFGPRGVLHCWATDKDDPTEQPRWGKVGKQKIEDTGPLTKKRMETCDDEFVRPAYLWTIFTNPAERGYLLHEGWKAMLRVFILTIVIDAIYQFIVLRWFYPGEVLITAFILAFVPYLLIRGPVNRIARVWNRSATGPGRGS
jgi:hypothetical protein